MRPRLLVTLAAAVLAATAVPLVAAPAAAAAPVSCSGTAKVFDARGDGTLWYYEHRAPATGDYNWADGRRIGAGFTGNTFAGPNGYVYLVTAAGELRRYQYGGDSWFDAIGTVLGTGWQEWSQYGDRTARIAVDSTGRLFAVDSLRNLRVYEPGTGRWDAGTGRLLAYDWSNVITAGDNVLYTRSAGDLLRRFTYDPDSQRLAEYDNPVGFGWQIFEEIFSPGGDVLYGITGNDMYWYRFDAATGLWDNEGNGRLVGNGWSQHFGVSARTNTCSAPAPAPVAPVTPAGVDPDHQLEIAGEGTGFRYGYLNDANQPMAAQDVGDRLHRAPIGSGKVFGTDLSAASGDAPRIVGVDTAGTAWISDFGPWQPFGKGFTRIALGDDSSGDQLTAVATDAGGRLWWRRQALDASHWTAWVLVSGTDQFAGFDHVAAAGGYAYGVGGDGRYWFSVGGLNLAADEFRIGSIPDGDQFADIVPVQTFATMALVGRNRADGQPYRLVADANDTFTTSTWEPLPPLSTDGSVTLDALPMSAAMDPMWVVTARGSDGYTYVTSTDSGWQPWQRLGPSVGAPAAIVVDFEVHLAFRGQDGSFHHYVDPDWSAPGPLRFTGGPRS